MSNNYKTVLSSKSFLEADIKENIDSFAIKAHKIFVKNNLEWIDSFKKEEYDITKTIETISKVLGVIDIEDKLKDALSENIYSIDIPDKKHVPSIDEIKDKLFEIYILSREMNEPWLAGAFLNVECNNKICKLRVVV
jgi:hypothetical protein